LDRLGYALGYCVPRKGCRLRKRIITSLVSVFPKGVTVGRTRLCSQLLYSQKGLRTKNKNEHILGYYIPLRGLQLERPGYSLGYRIYRRGDRLKKEYLRP
jgi:hypothetical protein